MNATTDRFCGGCAHPLAKKAGPPLAPPRRSKYSTRFPSFKSTVQIARIDIVDEKFND